MSGFSERVRRPPHLGLGISAEFDSARKGIDAVALREELPSESIVYFGDTARVPYGTKSKTTIVKFSLENVEFLLRFGVKCIVIACNTSSSWALPTLRKYFKVPIIGVIRPGALAAVSRTRNKRVGVIGTTATIHSGAYEAAIHRLDPSIKVFSQGCPLFVPLVEEGWLGKSETKQIIRRSLAPLCRLNIDTLILGCTHYPLLASAIAQRIGRRVRLVDPAAEVAETIERYLGQYPEVAGTLGRSGETRILVSDETPMFAKLTAQILGRKVAIEKIQNPNF
jgi:glutamate racemase